MVGAIRKDEAMGCFSPIHGLIFLVMVPVLWVLPIALGIWAARRKNFSPHWMWLGIHPIGGWAACIFLLCVSPRVECPNCGGFPWAYFRICPYCHAGLDFQSDRAGPSTPPPSP
jgi:hypothetical protein